MKLKFWLLLSPVLFGLLMPLFLGCNRTTPLNPPPPPTPTPDIIWADGVLGSWLNGTESTSSSPGCTVTGAVTAVTDNISGDTNSLRLTAANACGNYILSVASAVTVFSYYPSGHIQFDIRTEQPTSNINAVTVQYGYSGNGSTAAYVLPNSLLASLSTSSFTHVTVPFSSFTITNNATYPATGNPFSAVDTPFQLTWGATGSGTAFTVDDISWTPY